MTQFSDKSENISSASPSTPVECALAQMWSGLLGQERIGIHDDFFALGGNDELAAQLIAEIDEVFQIQLPALSLSDMPTVAGLAAIIEAARAESKHGTISPIQLVPHNRPVPLSFAQQRLWFLEQLDPGTPVYNNGGLTRLKGALNLTALEASLNEIVRRHEALRTTFTVVDGEPFQSILSELKLAVPVVNFQNLPESKRESEALRTANEETRRPFDLVSGPLVRALLLRLAPEEHLLLLIVHHIIFDAWSFNILSRELQALYDAFSAGQRSPLPELPLQYADYVSLATQVAAGRGSGRTTCLLETTTRRPADT